MNAAPEKKREEKYVRPKIRSRPAAAARPASTDGNDDVDKLLEHTRRRIQSQLAVTSGRNEMKTGSQQQQARKQTAPPHPSVAPHYTQTRAAAPSENADHQPKSILKTPKYSTKESASTTDPMDTSEATPDAPRAAANRPRAAVQDLVVEREPIAQECLAEPHAALSIEGHTPKQDSTVPMVVSSVSELMSQAGTLPPQDSAPQVVEADLSFACMTLEEYDETVKCAESSMDSNQEGDVAAGPDAMKENVFLGNEDVFSDDDSGDEGDSMFGESSVASEGEHDVAPPEPRAFMKIWQAITDWATPETVALLKQWRSDDKDHSTASDSVPQVDQSDVGSSRRRGLNAMLTMYLPSTMNNLGLQQEDRRRVEQRLDNVLRTLSFAMPMVKFDTKLWKAITCVLVDMVLVEASTLTRPRVMLPAAVQEVGMVADEYKYLTRSAVTNLEGVEHHS